MTSYRDAGVDLEGATRHVAEISSAVTATWNDQVFGGFGGFAAGVTLPPGYENPVLMMSTDGVGTKLEVARRVDSWSGVGHDLVAMCVDDLTAVGARPIGFVDYMAVGALRPVRDTSIVKSIASGCQQAKCPLLGGETAEHPGVMEADAVDLAGAVSGVVEQGLAWGPERVTSGDVIIGLSSPNLRSNGFSLVRRALGDDLERHGDVLLEPSVIYSPEVLEAGRVGRIHSAAHITGGGIAHNLGRALPKHLGTELDSAAWHVPEVFDLLAQYGIPREEMLRTFNMGIGFCLIVEGQSVDVVCEAVAKHNPVVVGRVQETPGVVIR